MKKGLFILAHGSRSEDSNIQLKEVVENLRLKGKEDFTSIGYGSMEMAEPGFRDGIDELAKDNLEEIIIVPLFLFKGNHIKKDIPRILEEIKEKHSNIKFTLKEPIGTDSRIIGILLDKAKED